MPARSLPACLVYVPHQGPASPLARRLTFPAYGGGGSPLGSIDLLLVCDSYLGLDQQYRIPLGRDSGTGAAALPLVGQAARRQRRQEQAEGRRQHAAGKPQEQPASSSSTTGGSPADADAGDMGQTTVEALPQRAPRRPRGAAAQQLEETQWQAPTLDCRLDGQAAEAK